MDVLLFNSIPNPMLYAPLKSKQNKRSFLIPLLAFIGIVSRVSRLVGGTTDIALRSESSPSSAGFRFCRSVQSPHLRIRFNFFCAGAKLFGRVPVNVADGYVLLVRLSGSGCQAGPSCSLRECGASGLHFVVSGRCRCERTSAAFLRVVTRKPCGAGYYPRSARCVGQFGLSQAVDRCWQYRFPCAPNRFSKA